MTPHVCWVYIATSPRYQCVMQKNGNEGKIGRTQGQLVKTTICIAMCRIHAKGWLHVAAMATAIELAWKWTLFRWVSVCKLSWQGVCFKECRLERVTPNKHSIGLKIHSLTQHNTADWKIVIFRHFPPLMKTKSLANVCKYLLLSKGDGKNLTTNSYNQHFSIILSGVKNLKPTPLPTLLPLIHTQPLIELARVNRKNMLNWQYNTISSQGPVILIIIWPSSNTYSLVRMILLDHSQLPGQVAVEAVHPRTRYRLCSRAYPQSFHWGAGGCRHHPHCCYCSAVSCSMPLAGLTVLEMKWRRRKRRSEAG